MARRAAMVIGVLVLLASFPEPAFADNCSGLYDCFSGNVLPAILLTLGLLLMITSPWWLPALLSRLALSAALRALASAGARVAARLLSRSWYRATFPNGGRCLLYHWGKKGGGRSLLGFTGDARRHFLVKR